MVRHHQPRKGSNDYETSNQKKLTNSQIELNIAKKTNKDKKYSLTTMNSRKNKSIISNKSRASKNI